MCSYRSSLVFNVAFKTLDISQGSVATHLIVLLQISSCFWQWNNFKNRIIFGIVNAYKNGAIFGSYNHTLGQFLNNVHYFIRHWPAVPVYLPRETSLYCSLSELTLKLSYSAYLFCSLKFAISTTSRWRLADVSRCSFSLPVHSIRAYDDTDISIDRVSAGSRCQQTSTIYYGVKQWYLTPLLFIHKCTAGSPLRRHLTQTSPFVCMKISGGG